MDKINIDLLEIICEYLEYKDIFTINILSNDIHKMFSKCKFNKTCITIRNPIITYIYKFENIEIIDSCLIKYLHLKRIKKIKTLLHR